ncbi:hypothetical protein TVAG_083570 [Trichomonas vaginalis G3]|uniref:Uncharacterized protein n=1 Tax=Trichomonas vaginalis (strain ATCC PRA-98 / G3) TaxID=412133 RepID=A2DM84_TRIV3|nr:amelogenin-related protein family [Trichomonas vaginalis G3]EAY18504.1 hypothetical protein TVAG_083570 [Trichomonas vaginalis G3]KAI5489507.1 amelogenin-related protein family [Trichomonas vaginalis G3]|eukprot:XP_001579490.1 hypothetical protein [Trichomonas vaginalis G3]
MIGFLLAQTLSISVTSTGYYKEYIYSSSSNTLSFRLPFDSSSNYYIVFTMKDTSLQLDSTSIDKTVYQISNLSAIYSLSVSNSGTLSFGVFRVPQTRDCLEIWINPYSSSRQYTIAKIRQNTFKRYVLLIICDHFFEITVHHSDYNSIYGSTDGSLPTSSFNSASNVHIATLQYEKEAQTLPDTWYELNTNADYSSEYEYYDDKGGNVVFSDGIYIRTLPEREELKPQPEKTTDIYPLMSYGPKSISLSNEYTTYIVSPNTTIVFTEPDDFEGIAKVGAQTLNILGSTSIRAVEFREKGTLQLSTRSSKTVYFVVYNYSTSNCDSLAIISGSKKFKLNIQRYFYYCVFSAFYSGKSKIETTDVEHKSYDTYHYPLYDSQSSYETVTKPCVTELENYYHDGEIIFNNDGSSNDDDYVIDGSSSKYDFYFINSNTSKKLNDGKSIGTVNGIPGYVIGIIVTIVIIVVIAIIITICCCVCCKKSGCCCARTSSNDNPQNSNRRENVPEHSAPRTSANSNTTVAVETHNVIATSPPPQQPQQQPQPQYYQPQPSYVPPAQQQQQPTPYGAPPEQPYPYGAPTQQPYPYGAPTQQPYPYGAPTQQPYPYGVSPQQAPVYGAPPPYAPPPSYTAPETKDDYDNPYQ